jgi:hypothetical protein
MSDKDRQRPEAEPDTPPEVLFGLGTEQSREDPAEDAGKLTWRIGGYGDRARATPRGAGDARPRRIPCRRRRRPGALVVLGSPLAYFPGLEQRYQQRLGAMG